MKFSGVLPFKCLENIGHAMESDLEKCSLSMLRHLRDCLQMFMSNWYREFVALYDIDMIFYKPH